MAIVTEKEWAEFRSAVLLKEDDTVVMEVLDYMRALQSDMRGGAKTSMTRSIGSVLRSYSKDDLARDVDMAGFMSKKGSGVRSFLEFTRRYEELKRMKRGRREH